MSLDKKETLVTLTRRLGVLGILESVARRDCVIALTYHRVGYHERCEYDPAVYSATPEQFDDQVRYLKSHFHVARLDEVLDGLDHPARLRGPHILITFDDGYLDNYQIATPILESHGVQGTFFLPTSFIGTDRLPWWDQIAYLVRRCGDREITLTYPSPVTLRLDAANMRASLRSILKLYKSPQMTDRHRFLEQLQQACAGEIQERAASRQFMTWSEAADMGRRGMAFGSHTHSHQLMAKLSFEEQVEELRVSRALLQTHLAVPGNVLAYPVGSPTAFSTVTFDALRQASYRAAFSHYGGVNTPSHLERFNLLRLQMGDMSLQRFRMNTATATVFGRQY